MAKKTDHVKEPWFLRRVFYVIIGLIGALLFAFGVADAAQIEEWTAAAERLVAPVLMVLTSVLAAPKANPGADKGASEKLDPTPVPQPIPSPAPETGTPVSLDKLRDLISQNVGQ